MQVSGFTIVRNAIKYDYPVVESILSVLPLCSEMIIAVGKSEDNTLELIRSINSDKIKIIETVWDDSLRIGGKVLAIETDKALAHVSTNADWCIYIQADEVLHQDDYPAILHAMNEYIDDDKVDGLLFNYIHFYGSYNYIANSPKWYQKEIRVFKNHRGVFSWGDAQGFRKKTAEKLNVKQIDATVMHYGWVKDPFAQQRKQESFHKMWHDDQWMKQNVVKADAFDYSSIDSLTAYTGKHPQVMQQRIAERNWQFEFDITKSNMRLKYRLKKWIKDKLGLSIGEYKNYKLI